jgi:hypothetical protein
LSCDSPRVGLDEVAQYDREIMVGMPTTNSPAFLDAYLVAVDSRGAPPLGVVQKEEAFATRQEAGVRLLKLA